MVRAVQRLSLSVGYLKYRTGHHGWEDTGKKRGRGGFAPLTKGSSLNVVPSPARILGMAVTIFGRVERRDNMYRVRNEVRRLVYHRLFW